VLTTSFSEFSGAAGCEGPAEFELTGDAGVARDATGSNSGEERSAASGMMVGV